MTAYLFVGGPADGRRMEVDDPPIVYRVPLPPPPVSVTGPKIVPFRRHRWADLTIDVAEYRRFGSLFWWEGLIGDAYGSMDVSAQVLAEGGPQMRRVIRHEMRQQLQALDPDKQLSRIVWRVTRNRSTWMFTLRAFVGPRAVPFGLKARADRRSGSEIGSAGA